MRTLLLYHAIIIFDLPSLLAMLLFVAITLTLPCCHYCFATHAIDAFDGYYCPCSRR